MDTPEFTLKKDGKDLTGINLHTTQVSDTDVTPFKDCKKLTALYLQKTKVTAAKVAELRKALPKCKIEYDARVIEPKAK